MGDPDLGGRTVTTSDDNNTAVKTLEQGGLRDVDNADVVGGMGSTAGGGSQHKFFMRVEGTTRWIEIEAFSFGASAESSGETDRVSLQFSDLSVRKTVDDASLDLAHLLLTEASGRSVEIQAFVKTPLVTGEAWVLSKAFLFENNAKAGENGGPPSPLVTEIGTASDNDGNLLESMLFNFTSVIERSYEYSDKISITPKAKDGEKYSFDLIRAQVGSASFEPSELDDFDPVTGATRLSRASKAASRSTASSWTSTAANSASRWRSPAKYPS